MIYQDESLTLYVPQTLRQFHGLLVTIPWRMTSLANIIYFLANGRYYPRDIGCSSAVNGHALFQFGDTFAHDSEGNFVGISCSNVALVKDIRKPNLCTYCDILPNGTVPTNPPLIPADRDDGHYRTTTWCFGGVVFPERQAGAVVEGYTFFQNSHIVGLVHRGGCAKCKWYLDR
jgi:hypothetical protein